jgi:hypothetical protein
MMLIKTRMTRRRRNMEFVAAKGKRKQRLSSHPCVRSVLQANG